MYTLTNKVTRTCMIEVTCSSELRVELSMHRWGVQSSAGEWQWKRRRKEKRKKRTCVEITRLTERRWGCGRVAGIHVVVSVDE